MTDSQTLQFGIPEPGVAYRDRSAAFGIAARNGKIATVRVTIPDRASWFDLPGGALDPGEDDIHAVVRELGEETGLMVRAGPSIVRASQYFRMNDGEPVDNRSGHYVVEIFGEDPALKIEDDHELVWMAPEEAMKRLRHDSHAWAVLSWLRALDRASPDD
jgi:8-oxo-dGTP diphosphatase